MITIRKSNNKFLLKQNMNSSMSFRTEDVFQQKDKFIFKEIKYDFYQP
jgi:hypothetical protein